MTAYLASIFGIYLAVAGTALLINPAIARGILDDFNANAALAYFCGAVMTVAGAALVLRHNIWQGWPEIMVTLFGWGALIEGAMMLIIPGPFMAFSKKLMPRSDGVVRGFGVFAILLGAAVAFL